VSHRLIALKKDGGLEARKTSTSTMRLTSEWRLSYFGSLLFQRRPTSFLCWFQVIQWNTDICVNWYSQCVKQNLCFLLCSSDTAVNCKSRIIVLDHPVLRLYLCAGALTYCQGKLSVRVRPSVKLRCHGHTGWNSAKIISRLISLTLCRPQHGRCTPKGTPQILAGIGVGRETVQDRVQVAIDH